MSAKKSLTAERRNQIAKILMKEGSIKVGDLSRRFNVSTETIRKDIIYLDEEGIAEKSFGGAIVRCERIAPALDARESRQSEEKADIAMKAVSLIPPNSAVLLDSGSTTKAIARQLTLMSGLKIFTNSIAIASLLSKSDNDLYMIGGRLRPASKACVGEWADSALGQLHVDIAFLGTDGVRGLSGPSALSYAETQFKVRALGAAARVYAVADSSKFESSGLFAYAAWKDLTGLITDRDAPPRMLQDISQSCQVILA